MVKRQLSNLSGVFELLHFKTPEPSPRRRRLDATLTTWDLHEIAKRHTPAAAFDYTDSAAEGEVSLRRVRQAFRDIEFHPDILRPAINVDTSCEILGGRSSMLFGIAPTGSTRLIQTEGEVAGTRAAGAAGTPFTLSTPGTTSIEGVKAADPHGYNWFQLYAMRQREISYGLVERAAATGPDALMSTVDTLVAGARLRDRRNGFSIPPQITIGTVLNAIPRPRWWFGFLTTPKLEFASLKSTGGIVGELLDNAMDPIISDEGLKVIRPMWPGKIVIKGVQTMEDSKRLIDLGVDGVLLSSHGGRQLDRTPVPFRLLPEVVREVSRDATIMVDTGIMSGVDVMAAVALGAEFGLVDRACLYGLMTGRREGVNRMIEILSDEVIRTMKLLGVSSLDELELRHVTQLTRLAPVRPNVRAAVDVLACWGPRPA